MERDDDGTHQKTIITISTHTLTWSVTTSVTVTDDSTGNFNSHAHVERDETHELNGQKLTKFQLTRSRGA